MRCRDALIITVVLIATALQAGCSSSASTGAASTEKAKQSYKSAAPPGMDDLYKGQASDTSKVVPKYPAGYPGMPKDGAGPPKTGNP